MALFYVSDHFQPNFFFKIHRQTLFYAYVMTIFDDLRARRKSSMDFRLWLLLCGKETDDAHFYVGVTYFRSFVICTDQHIAVFLFLPLLSGSTNGKSILPVERTLVTLNWLRTNSSYEDMVLKSGISKGAVSESIRDVSNFPFFCFSAFLLYVLSPHWSTNAF